jgi:hypothetical protein
MARTALSVVGGIVGGIFGMPQLGFALGSAIGSAVDPEIIQGPRIGETGAQTSAEGSPRAIVYGTVSVTGNIIQSGRLVKGDVISGGKGGEAKQSNEICIRTYAIRICEGPIAGVLRIWEDDKLVYDVRDGSTITAESDKWFFGCGIYLGTETQMPDSFLMTQAGPEPTGAAPDTPAYRGTAYMVFVGRDLTDRRGSIPQYRFEVAKATSEVTVNLPKINPRFLGGTTAGGTFTDYFIAGSTMSTPGSCWLAVWYFTPTVSSTPALQVKVAGAVVWTQFVSLTAGTPQLVKVQINHPPDGSAFTLGFMGTVTGGIDLSIYGLAADYHFYLADGQTSADNYESTRPDFGVLEDSSGNLAYGGPVNVIGPILPTPWGPTTIVTGTVGAPVALSSIIADIHDRCGVPSTKRDVSELTDSVTGLVLAGDYTGADVIDVARSQYFFDKAEYDKKLYYPKRGKAVAGSITIDDLIEVPDLSRREQAVEFPKKLHLQYQHAASGYPTVKATSQRSSPDVRVVGEVTMQTPFVLDENQAAQSAEKRHKVAFAEAEGELVVSVPDSLIKYVPSDVLAVTLRGRTSRERLEKMEYADGVIKWTLRKDRQSAYTSSLTGVPIPLPTAPPPTITGDTVLIVADISGRQDPEDDLHYLVAVSGSMPAWYGALVQRSLDGGASFTDAVTINRAARIGTLLTAVTAASDDYTDRTNVVRVQLYRDTQEIDGITDAQFRSEGGAFLLEKADGTHEVMQYRDAVDEGGGIFALSVLNRGRLNSGAAAHAVGAKFVMLEDMTHVPAQSAWIGQTLTHRGVSFEQSPELAAAQSKTFVGRSQVEWPVASFRLSRSGNNVTTTWAPRHRFGSDDSPLASINFQGFRLTFVGTSTVTFDQTAPTSTYDVSAIGGSVTVSVASINRITGAGPATSGTI